MTTNIKAFDKSGDRNALMGLAYGLQITHVNSVQELLGDACVGLFVHVGEDDWNNICRCLPEGRFALRFSTDGYPPKRPEGRYFNCFHCLKHTKGDYRISAAEFKALSQAFSDPKVAGSLGNAILPALRSLIRFYEPHRLRALHFLLQACMVQWAADDPKHGPCALELLGIVYLPPIRRDVNRVSLFKKILMESSAPSRDVEKLNSEIVEQIRNELGVDADFRGAPIPAILKLIGEIDGDVTGSLPITWETAKSLFEGLDELFGVRHTPSP